MRTDVNIPEAAGRGREAGFSLLEMIIIVVIIGITLASAVPSMGHRQEWARLEGSARALSTRLQTARALAVSHRVPYRVVLNAGGMSYVIERQLDDSTWVREPAEAYRVEGVDEMTMDVGGGSDSTVVLEPRGTVADASAPTVVRFLGTRGDTAEVSMVRTGRVTVRMGRAQ
jgi:type II secretion system protein H